MQEGPKTAQFRRRVVVLMLAGYSVFVMLITWSPRMPGADFVRKVVNRILRSLHSRDLFMNADYLTFEFIGNILMFIPHGIFTALLISQRQWWVLLFLGTLLSAAIELGQMVFLPGRVPEVRDLLSNSTGFLLGATGSVILRLLVAHRDGLVERDRRDAELHATQVRS